MIQLKFHNSLLHFLNKASLDFLQLKKSKVNPVL